MAERIRRAGQVAWAIVGLAALVGLLLLAGWFVRVIFPPLLLAGALVFVLHPVVSRFQRHGLPRAFGTGLTYGLILGIIVLAGLLVYPLVRSQADDLRDEWPSIESDLEVWVDDLAETTEDWPISVPPYDEIEDEVAGNNENDDDVSIGETVEQVRDIGGRVFHVALIIFLAPVIAFYLLVDLPRLGVVSRSLIPQQSRGEVLHVANRLNRAIGGFFRGQLLVAFIVGTMVSIGLAIIGLDFWILVGMIAGIFNIVPLIGPWVGGIPAVAIALTTEDVRTAIIVVLIMAGAQQIDNHFISPMVMQRAVKLHPAAVLLALLAGGTIGGFLGLLMAVPLAAVLKIVIGHLWHTYVLGETWEEAAIEELAAEGLAPGLVEDLV
jgi:predicted PurR-regulated permease PerM